MKFKRTFDKEFVDEQIEKAIGKDRPLQWTLVELKRCYAIIEQAEKMAEYYRNKTEPIIHREYRNEQYRVAGFKDDGMLAKEFLEMLGKE